MARTKWLLIAGVAALSCGVFLAASFAQRETSQDRFKEPILATLTAQQNAWNEGNVDAFLDGYWHSEELTFSGSQGISRGYNEVRERYRKGYPDRAAMGKLDFSGLEVRALGPKSALVLGHWHLTREKGDIGGVFSLVLERFPKGWKIIHDHTSVVLAPAAHN
jgi:ketosteroid isomerase-like protein